MSQVTCHRRFSSRGFLGIGDSPLCFSTAGRRRTSQAWARVCPIVDGMTHTTTELAKARRSRSERLQFGDPPPRIPHSWWDARCYPPGRGSVVDSERCALWWSSVSRSAYRLTQQSRHTTSNNSGGEDGPPDRIVGHTRDKLETLAISTGRDRGENMPCDPVCQ